MKTRFAIIPVSLGLGEEFIGLTMGGEDFSRVSLSMDCLIRGRDNRSEIATGMVHVPSEVTDGGLDCWFTVRKEPVVDGLGATENKVVSISDQEVRAAISYVLGAEAFESEAEEFSAVVVVPEETSPEHFDSKVFVESTYQNVQSNRRISIPIATIFSVGELLLWDYFLCLESEILGPGIDEQKLALGSEKNVGLVFVDDEKSLNIGVSYSVVALGECPDVNRIADPVSFDNDDAVEIFSENLDLVLVAHPGDEHGAYILEGGEPLSVLDGYSKYNALSSECKGRKR